MPKSYEKSVAEKQKYYYCITKYGRIQDDIIMVELHPVGTPLKCDVIPHWIWCLIPKTFSYGTSSGLDKLPILFTVNATSAQNRDECCKCLAPALQ